MLNFGRFSVAKSITLHSFQHRNLCLDPNKLKKWEFARDIFTVGMVQIPTTCSSAPYCSLKKERKALSSLGKINYLSKSLSKSSKVLATLWLPSSLQNSFFLGNRSRYKWNRAYECMTNMIHGKSLTAILCFTKKYSKRN